MKLAKPSLFRQTCFINNQWITAQETLSVYNPATQEIIGEAPSLGKNRILEAISAAEKAKPFWQTKTAEERAHYLSLWHQAILENSVDLATLLTIEQGKPIKEAIEEIRYGASFISWFAEEAKRVYGDIIPSPSSKQQLYVCKQPIGVVGALTPWNFPNAMITRKCAPALAAGCTVIVKPSSLTPFSAFALAALAEEVGFPPGVFNVITGNSSLISDSFTNHPSIRKLSFTGSTAVGRLLMKKAASSIKKISLELGGNAPFIVFEDADIEQSVQGAIASKFRNNGQTCICANRFYVHTSIYSAWTRKLIQAIKLLKLGNGLNPDVQLGPLINEVAIKKVQKHIEDALSKGAKQLLGNEINPKLKGHFFQPTVLSDCSSDMLIAQEETFGPVVGLFKFTTDQEAIALANATEYGLAAYFYSQHLNRITSVTQQLDFGIIGVNSGFISYAAAPFGGLKQSGIGREGSRYGIDEYLEKKYICLQTS